jgi:S-formylglutathione hydrolase FrmB
MATLPSAPLWTPQPHRLAVICLAIAVTALGLVGFARYVHDYMLYRGFGPPVATVPPSARGRIATLVFRSRALGGRSESALVYLPAAYRTHPRRRFPVAYLLHGTPGDPRTAFVNSLHVAPRLDLLIMRHRARPLIVVMPPGSPSTYDRATEWANGTGRDAHWFTYLTHDLIDAVDTHLRTIRSASGRGIGGYSSGADAALNAILLCPHLYSVAEGWSGDYRQTPATVGREAALVRRFSAIDSAPLRARELAAAGAHVYLYAGRRDRVLANTMLVDRALRAAGVHTLLDVTGGGHAWALWSRRLDGSLRYFSDHLTRPRR